MKAALAAWLERRWYGGVAPAWPLRALAGIYGSIVRRRRAAFLARGAARVGVPVIVVGNLAVGGAGKTPLVIALVQALRARGYGGSATGPERVGGDSDPGRVGDEPCMIARRTGAPVAIARKRAAAARLLVGSHEVDVLVADDGLQHYALARDLEIAVIDGRRRYGNGALLPAGPLREPRARAADCDYRVLNGGEAQADEVPMRLRPGEAVALDGSGARALSTFAGRRVHAVAGIGDPSRFFDALRAHGIDVVPHPFPDHHAYRPADLAFKEPLPVLMTEKDAVKCRAFAAPDRYAVPVDAELPADFFDALAQRLRGAVGGAR
jgi:tetraacyldisaccharide 4'-kinase